MLFIIICKLIFKDNILRVCIYVLNIEICTTKFMIGDAYLEIVDGQVKVVDGQLGVVDG